MLTGWPLRRSPEEREILGRISPEKRSRPAQGSEPAAKLLWRRVAMRGSSQPQVFPRSLKGP
jgi:hypothetical protein